MCNSNSIASFNRKRPEKLKTPWTNYFFCLLLGSFSEKKGGTCGKESIRIPCSTGPAHWAWDLCCLGHFHPCRMRPNHSLTLAFYSVWTVQPFTIRLCQQLADSFDIWLQITRRWSVCQSVSQAADWICFTSEYWGKSQASHWELVYLVL